MLAQHSCTGDWSSASSIKRKWKSIFHNIHNLNLFSCHTRLQSISGAKQVPKQRLSAFNVDIIHKISWNIWIILFKHWDAKPPNTTAYQSTQNPFTFPFSHIPVVWFENYYLLQSIHFCKQIINKNKWNNMKIITLAALLDRMVVRKCNGNISTIQWQSIICLELSMKAQVQFLISSDKDFK